MGLILASQSSARQNMLCNAGINFKSIPADLDEEKIINDLLNEGASSGNIATTLAKEKALSISKINLEDYIIGSDQVLSMDEKIYSKVKTKEEAIKRLLEFQGKEHFLTSSVAVARAGKILWHKMDAVALKMKPMSHQDIEKYAENVGDVLISCVGCYAIESLGIRLFKEIRGDFFTILGMPLLPLLNFLEKERVV
jgi:septum formation protein